MILGWLLNNLHIQEWDRTSVFKTSYTDIPLVGWKFAVVLDALTRHAKVLWCDANAELRRPLTAIRHSLQQKGYFLTVAGHRFPTPKTVRPATLQHFDCRAAFASKQECTSAYLGVVRGSELHALLPSLDKCASSRECLYPSDAVGNTNQRRDQSVLNAALCHSDIKCDADRKFWMWAGQKVFTPTGRSIFLELVGVVFQKGPRRALFAERRRGVEREAARGRL